MQVCVTSGKIKSKSKLRSSLVTLVVFIFAFVSTIILVNVRKKSLIFEQQFFYFVSADSSKKSAVLENEREFLKNIGGASVIYFDRHNYYLIANVYLDVADANEIKTNLVENFKNSEVLTIKTKKLSKESQKEINNNLEIKRFIWFLYEFKKEFQEQALNYYLGTLSESDFISKIISNNLKFDEFKEIITGDGALVAAAKEYAGLFSLQFSSFLNNFYIAKNKQNYVSAYYVGFVINYLDFYECL